MKIKSWTGGTADARVGMCVDTARFGSEQVTIHMLPDVESLKDCLHVEHKGGFTWVYAKECRMLRAPFVVGDSVEVRDCETGEFDYAGEITAIDGGYIEIDGLTGCEDFLSIRHANPDLRTSPDYEAKV